MRVTMALLTWNHAASVGAAIASLRAQDYSDLEILVQDDGSTDDTLAVATAAAAGDPRVRILSTPRNLGGWGNFRLAAERATGDVICWACPGDDWAPDFVSTLAARMTERPGSVAAMCGTIDVDEVTRLEIGRRPVAGFGSPESMGWLTLACTVLIKTRPNDGRRPHYSLMSHGLIDRRVLLGVLDAQAGLGPVLNERGVLAHLALAGPFAVTDAWLFRKEHHTLPAIVRGPHVESRRARTDARFLFTRISWQIARAMTRSTVVPWPRKLATPLVVGQYYVRSVASLACHAIVAWMHRLLPSSVYRLVRNLYRGAAGRRQGAAE